MGIRRPLWCYRVAVSSVAVIFATVVVFFSSPGTSSGAASFVAVAPSSKHIFRAATTFPRLYNNQQITKGGNCFEPIQQSTNNQRGQLFQIRLIGESLRSFVDVSFAT
jgi:hypothetical protein